MKSMIQLNEQIFKMKFPWNLWVGMLAMVNMAVCMLKIGNYREAFNTMERAK